VASDLTFAATHNITFLGHLFTQVQIQIGQRVWRLYLASKVPQAIETKQRGHLVSLFFYARRKYS
jgi:hypothetical protein